MILILLWVGFLGIYFDVCVGGGGGGLRRVGAYQITPCPSPPSCLKLVRNMLQTWNLVRIYMHKCSFRKYDF